MIIFFLQHPGVSKVGVILYHFKVHVLYVFVPHNKKWKPAFFLLILLHGPAFLYGGNGGLLLWLVYTMFFVQYLIWQAKQFYCQFDDLERPPTSSASCVPLAAMFLGPNTVRWCFVSGSSAISIAFCSV